MNLDKLCSTLTCCFTCESVDHSIEKTEGPLTRNNQLIFTSYFRSPVFAFNDISLEKRKNEPLSDHKKRPVIKKVKDIFKKIQTTTAHS